jgi:outer membrane receptor for ferrienterochelin and colicin
MSYCPSFKKNLAAAVRCAVIAAAASVPVTVLAQETTSAIRGVVTDEAGNPLSGSTIAIRNDSKAFSRSIATGADGEFNLRNLPVGSGYVVTVTRSGYAGESTENLLLNLGQTAELTFSLSSSGNIEEITVVGSTGITNQVALGPSVTFNLEDLQTAPAINRNIADVLRIDPRIYVDESRGDINAVQCGGKNSRFNSLTVDGVRTNDSFGLNANGYPTERMPFSFDAIQQVSVEMAPFDVEYGGFTACNINAVTKSGSNEFYGSGFMDYTDNDLRADSLEGDKITTGDYDEKRFGLNIGGPIIQDTLFFFAAYEKLEGANLFDRGPIGSGAVNEIQVTQAELDEIADIARTVYQYDPGSMPVGKDHEDEKILLKLDWNINEDHRLAFTYNYNDGWNFVESDGGLDEYEFENHLYERGSELNSSVASLYSNWTPDFSTEIRLGRLELDNRQISVGGNDFGEMQIQLDDVNVYIGGDDSRQANKLNYEVDSFAIKGDYLLNSGHTLTFGVERESLDVFNLFVQHTETEIRFTGIENFRNGFANAIYYNNAPSNNADDAAAVWGYEVNTVYGQDEFFIGDNITIVTGLRYDWYTTGDKPAENPDFVADYGFSNATNLDGEGLLQPRLGFTWYPSEALSVRGGAGLYTGGNPNVWLSNNFSANNVLQFGQRGRSFGYTDGSRSLFDPDVVYLGLEPGVPAGPGYGIPSEIYNAVAGSTGDNFEINYLDPEFELPSEWKISLGMTYYFPNDFTLDADVLVTRAKDSAIVLRGDLEQVGTTPEGYPVYNSVREPAFVLTNSHSGDESFGASIALNKSYDNGMRWSLGYAYTDAKDVQPMTSSVAFSNYTNRVFFDPQEQKLAPSNYNIAHRITGMFNWDANFFGSNLTRMSLYGAWHEGQPWSYAFDGTINPYNFTPFLDFQPRVLAPGDSRNENDGSWWGKIDLRIEQQFPGFSPNSNGAVFLVIDNLTNLINDDWGILEQVNFPNAVVRGTQAEARRGDASRYEIRFGVKYDF